MSSSHSYTSSSKFLSFLSKEPNCFTERLFESRTDLQVEGGDADSLCQYQNEAASNSVLSRLNIKKVYSREKCTCAEQLAGTTLLHEWLCCPYRKKNLFKIESQPETKMLQTGLVTRGSQDISDHMD